MKLTENIHARDFFLAPNLMSAARVILILPIVYFLSLPWEHSGKICLLLMGVAAITDFLDGFLARKYNKITRLGLILDPLADKLMTIAVIIGLIIYRAFPFWLALAIMGRDLVILGAAALLAGDSDRIPPSDVYGKYYFASIAALIIADITYFDFGLKLFTIITIVLLGITMISYGFRLVALKQGRELNDHPLNNKTLHYLVGIIWNAAVLVSVYLAVKSLV